MPLHDNIKVWKKEVCVLRLKCYEKKNVTDSKNLLKLFTFTKA